MWKTVRVFVSSTFKDMASERDHLVRFVFPRLREELQSRQLHFIDVDLRWGVTSDQDALELCIDEIRRCQPRFIALLGGRYGWVPPPRSLAGAVVDRLLNGETSPLSEGDRRILREMYVRENPDRPYHLTSPPIEPAEYALWARRREDLAGILERAGLAEELRSITASEILFGALERLHEPAFRYFYIRGDSSTTSIPAEESIVYREPSGSLSERRLALLKARIRDSRGVTVVAPGRTEERPLPWCEYSAEWDQQTRRLIGLSRFGDMVYADLLASIEAEFGPPEPVTPDEFAEERAATDAFIEQVTNRYVVGSRRRELERLRVYAADRGEPLCLVVAGEAGIGESALLAKFCSEYEQVMEANSGDRPRRLIAHFVGASKRSTNAQFMLRRLWNDLISLAGSDELIPETFEDLRRGLPRLLDRVAGKANVLIVIDALDQLDPTYDARGLHWLPKSLPLGVRVIVSVTQGAILDALLSRRDPRCQVVHLDPLTEGDAGEIADRFLESYRKTLEPDQRRQLLSKTDSRNPLYLLTALEELRTLGTYEEITTRIRELPGRTLPLFSWILDRLEVDQMFRSPEGSLIGGDLVKNYCAYIAVSRSGLSQRELVDLIEPRDPQGNLAALYRLLRPQLVARGELLDLSHGQLRAAVHDRYLSSESSPARFVDAKSLHESLAEFLNERWAAPDLHALEELPYHAAQSGSVELLANIVRGDFFETQAARLGSASAMTDARMVAEELARAGESWWDDLVRCAWVHCALSERVRAEPEAFEVLINQGHFDRVMGVIKLEQEPLRQAKMMLATAAFLDEAGRHEQAQSLRERASSGASRATGDSKYLLECLQQESISEQPQSRSGPASPSHGELLPSLAEPAPRTRVPFDLFILAAMSSESDHVLSSGTLAWTVALVGLNYWQGWTAAASGPLEVGFWTGLVLFYLSMYWAKFPLRAQTRRVHRVLLQLERAYAQSTLQSAQRIALRMLRFKTILPDRFDTAPWAEIVSRVAVRALRSSGEDDAAELLVTAGKAGDSVRETLARELQGFDHKRLTRLFERTATRLTGIIERWNLFKIFAASSHTGSQPDLLLQLFGKPPRSSTGTPEEQDEKLRQEALSALRRIPKVVVGRAVLATISEGSEPGARAPEVVGNSLGFLGSAVVGIKRPMHPLEPMVTILVLLPLICVLLLFAALLALSFAAITLWTVAMRHCDPRRLLTIPSTGDRLEYRRSIAATVRDRPLWQQGIGDWRLLDTLLALGVVDPGEQEESFRARFSQKRIRRVLRTLSAKGLLGGRSDVVLAVMQDRPLLEAATGLQDSSPVQRFTTGADHEQQLRRVLPVQRASLNIALVGLLSCLAMGLWVELSGWVLPRPVSELLALRGPWWWLAGCGALVVFQHLPGAPVGLSLGLPVDTGEREAPVATPPGAFNRIKARLRLAESIRFFGAALIYLGTIALLSDGRGILLIPLVLPAVPLLITNLLVPELVAEWRGGGQLYPSSAQLWTRRLLALLGFLIACGILLVVFAALSHALVLFRRIG